MLVHSFEGPFRNPLLFWARKLAKQAILAWQNRTILLFNVEVALSRSSNVMQTMNGAVSTTTGTAAQPSLFHKGFAKYLQNGTFSDLTLVCNNAQYKVCTNLHGDTDSYLTYGNHVSHEHSNVKVTRCIGS